MPPDTKKSMLPGAISNSIIAAGMILSSAGVNGDDSSTAPQKNTANADATVDPIQQEVDYLRRKMKEYHGDKAETNHPATKEEVDQQKNIHILINQLGSNEYTARESASDELAKIGYAAKPELVEAATMQPNADLERVTRARNLLKPLLAVDKKRAENLATAVVRLGALGSNASNAVPDLIPFLAETDDRKLVEATIDTLGKIGPDAKEAVPALVKLVKSDEKKDDPIDLNMRAIEALGKIGPDAKEAVPQLIDALKSNDASWKQSSATALGQIKEVKETVPALIYALKSQDSTLRYNAVTALAGIKETKQTIPALISILKNENDVDVKQAIITSLGNFGPEAISAIPALQAVAEAKPPAASPGGYILISEFFQNRALTGFYETKTIASEAIKKIDPSKAHAIEVPTVPSVKNAARQNR